MWCVSLIKARFSLKSNREIFHEPTTTWWNSVHKNGEHFIISSKKNYHFKNSQYKKFERIEQENVN